MPGFGKIVIRFSLPKPELAPFITTYYHTENRAPQDDEPVEDYLHPEWANFRFLDHCSCSHAIGSGRLVSTPNLAVTGPTSLATRFTMSHGRSWGIGLLPLGWSWLFDVPACEYADRAVDGRSDPAFEILTPLAEALAQSDGDFDMELSIIEAHMRALLGRPFRDRYAITAINQALVDPEVATVSELAERAGMSVRSLERISSRAFGFSPKLMLRRQRFLRSLAQFMLDPTMKWLNAMDYHYHDQAHFVRDFRRFMGMPPSQYRRLNHPFLQSAARARAAIAGEAVQALQVPPPAPRS